ncbi:MAG: nodulation protein E [Gammaproteobacteria bacterium]|nr:nodulation protein E [Gammaproteobacteria bacterium]
MSLTDQASSSNAEDLGVSAQEFLAYCNAERERRRNSGEMFDQQAFDAAVDLVLRKLRALAEEGWT